jgi:hypothetical protein
MVWGSQRGASLSCCRKKAQDPNKDEVLIASPSVPWTPLPLETQVEEESLDRVRRPVYWAQLCPPPPSCVALGKSLSSLACLFSHLIRVGLRPE